MNYSAPASGLPTYVTGPSKLVEPYSLRTNASVFAPIDGGVVNAAVDGVVTGFQSGSEGLRDVGTVTVEIPPGGVGEVDFFVLGPPPSAASADIVPALELTPGVNPWVESADVLRPCVPSGN